MVKVLGPYDPILPCELGNPSIIRTSVACEDAFDTRMAKARAEIDFIFKTKFPINPVVRDIGFSILSLIYFFGDKVKNKRCLRLPVLSNNEK